MRFHSFNFLQLERLSYEREQSVPSMSFIKPGYEEKIPTFDLDVLIVSFLFGYPKPVGYSTAVRKSLIHKESNVIKGFQKFVQGPRTPKVSSSD